MWSNESRGSSLAASESMGGREVNPTKENQGLFQREKSEGYKIGNFNLQEPQQ